MPFLWKQKCIVYKYSALFRKSYQKEFRTKISKFYGEEEEEP